MRGWILATVLVARAAFGDAAIPGDKAGAPSVGREQGIGLPALSSDGKQLAIDVTAADSRLSMMVQVLSPEGNRLAGTRISTMLTAEQAFIHVGRFLRTRGQFVPLTPTTESLLPPKVRVRLARGEFGGFDCDPKDDCRPERITPKPIFTFYRTPDGGTVIMAAPYAWMPRRFWFVPKA